MRINYKVYTQNTRVAKGLKCYEVLIDCPEDITLTVALSYQLFLSSTVRPNDWIVFNNGVRLTTYGTGFAGGLQLRADTKKKIERIKIISVKEYVEPKEEPKLFKV